MARILRADGGRFAEDSEAAGLSAGLSDNTVGDSADAVGASGEFSGVSVLVRENLLQIRLSLALREILKEPSIDRFAALNEPVVLGILKFLSKGYDSDQILQVKRLECKVALYGCAMRKHQR